MQASVLQEQFHTAVNTVGRVVNSRSNLPVLENILLETVDSRLVLTASDLQTSIQVRIGAKVDQPGGITLPAKTLKELVGALAPERVDLKLDGEAQSVRVKCGTTTSTIKGIAASEFPPMGEVEGVGLTLASADKRALRHVLPSVSKEDNRPILMGVAFVFEAGCLTLAAADGFRLALYRLSVPVDAARTFVVPGRAVKVLVDVLDDDGDVQCVFSDEAAAFEGTSVLVRAQLLEGKFPDFDAVIPKTWTTRFTAYTADLLRALKRAEVFSRDNNNSTRLEVLGAAGDATIQLRVTGRSGERGDSETDIAIAGEGNTLTAFFNVRYMLDLLAVVETERVVFESAGAASAGVWREEGGDSFIQILMPISGGRYS